MPIEITGEFGTPGAEPEWLQAQGTLAILHIQKICGDPPLEMELEIVWQEHDLGQYPTIGLTWEDGMRGAPSEYISRCQQTLTAYEDGEDPPSWSVPWDFEGESDEEANRDAPEIPPEPPPDASLWELDCYLSRLTEYAVRAAVRSNGRPHLVEEDENDVSG